MSTTTTSPKFKLTNPFAAPYKRRRVERAQGAFKRETINQLDVVMGTPELLVPADHLARKVRALVATLDIGTLGVRRPTGSGSTEVLVNTHDCASDRPHLN